jgi:hypothetical protein
MSMPWWVLSGVAALAVLAIVIAGVRRFREIKAAQEQEQKQEALREQLRQQLSPELLFGAFGCRDVSYLSRYQLDEILEAQYADLTHYALEQVALRAETRRDSLRRMSDHVDISNLLRSFGCRDVSDLTPDQLDVIFEEFRRAQLRSSAPSSGSASSPIGGVLRHRVEKRGIEGLRACMST